MDVRIEMRKKDFKKTFDDPRRRREEQQVQIRKQNREARLTEKRRAALEELPEDGAPTFGSSGAGDPGAPGGLSVAQIPEMAQAVLSADPAAQFEATQNFRKLLSIAKNPPIQEVINAGVVPRFVEFLYDDNRPEIQFQAAWALTNIASGTQEQTQLVVEHGAIPAFVRVLSSAKADTREQAIWGLGNIAGDCPSCRDLVFKEGALEPLLEQVRSYLRADAPDVRHTMLTNATWTLSNLCRGKPRPELDWIYPALPVIRELLYNKDPEVLTDACWALSYLSEGSDDRSTTDAIDMILNAGVAARLVQLLCHPSHLVQTPALRAVGNIVSGNDTQTQAMVVCGCVGALYSLLQTAKKTVVRKEACWTLSNITAGNKEQIEEVIKQGIIPMLVQMWPTVELEIQKEIGWALANAASGAVGPQVQYLVNAKVIRPLCDCLGVQDDDKLVGASLEALLNILEVGKQLQEKSGATENPYVILMEEAEAYPKLEQLQYADENAKKYKLAMQIMTTYLSYEEEIDDNAPDAACYETFGAAARPAAPQVSGTAAPSVAAAAPEGGAPPTTFFNFGDSATHHP